MTTPHLTLTEELLLLLLDDETGKSLVDGTRRRAMVAGAALAELALDGALTLDEDPRPRRSKLRAVDGAVPAEYLGDALERADGCTPKDAIARIGGAMDFKLRADAIRDAVMAGLTDRGVVEAHEPRALGLVGPRWVLRQPEVEAPSRERLLAVLDGAEVDPRTAALLALVHAGGLLPKIAPGRDRKADDARVTQVAEVGWEGDAVARAIAEINMMLMTAVIVPIVVSS